MPNPASKHSQVVNGGILLHAPCIVVRSNLFPSLACCQFFALICFQKLPHLNADFVAARSIVACVACIRKAEKVEFRQGFIEPAIVQIVDSFVGDFCTIRLGVGCSNSLGIHPRAIKALIPFLPPSLSPLPHEC